MANSDLPTTAASSPRLVQLALALFFVALIGVVPITQLLCDLAGGAKIQALEVYSGPASVPGEFTGGADPGCGAVVIWTRR